MLTCSIFTRGSHSYRFYRMVNAHSGPTYTDPWHPHMNTSVDARVEALVDGIQQFGKIWEQHIQLSSSCRSAPILYPNMG